MKAIIMMVSMLLVTSVAYAVPCGDVYQNSPQANQEQGQCQGQAQGQLQGQGQGQDASNSNSISGDENKTLAIAYGAPSLSGAEGVETAQIQSFLGGISLSDTEQYKKNSEAIYMTATMEKAGYLSNDEAKVAANEFFSEVRRSVKPKRDLLTLGFTKSRGKTILNLYGLLSI